MIKLNDEPINITHFPDGTSQVWKLPEELLKADNIASIYWNFEHEGEFMHLAQLKTLLDSYGRVCYLHINFLPYARQDKEVSNSTTFALRTFTGLLNSLRFEGITIMDPHSEVATDNITKAFAIYSFEQLKKTLEITKSNTVCYPDNGAKIKYEIVYRHVFQDLDKLYGEKTRDQLTGYIKEYKLNGDPTGKSVLIVDDIIDGGGTFRMLSELLYNKGALEVNLFASHGVFSKGLKPLKDAGIKRIFTKDGEVFEHQGHICYKPDTKL